MANILSNYYYKIMMSNFMLKKYRKKHKLDKTIEYYAGYGFLYSCLYLERIFEIKWDEAKSMEVYHTYWDIYNKKDAIDTIERLLSGSIHKEKFDSILASKKSDTNFKVWSEQIIDSLNESSYPNFINQTDFEKCQTTLAWNLERSAMIARDFYGWGKISKKDLLNYLKKISTLAQQEFNNWKEYHISFLVGRALWSGFEINTNFINKIKMFYFYRDKNDPIPFGQEFPLKNYNVDRHLSFQERYGFNPCPRTDVILQDDLSNTLLQPYRSPDKKRIKKYDKTLDRGINKYNIAKLISSLGVGIKIFTGYSKVIGSLWCVVTSLIMISVMGGESKQEIYSKGLLVPSIFIDKQTNLLIALVPISPDNNSNAYWKICTISYEKFPDEFKTINKKIACVLEIDLSEEDYLTEDNTLIHPTVFGYSNKKDLDYFTDVIDCSQFYPENVWEFLENHASKYKNSEDVILLDKELNEISL